jgi:hypothetical protein
MAAWELVPCLVGLREEFNLLAPARAKASDGSIGDQSHAAGRSDHNPDETGNTPTEDSDRKNEVHAIDVDSNLRKAGWDMDRCLDIIITRHRTGQDDRLQNVIYNRRIWSRSWGWTARAYTGASAHTEHAHFSARYTTTQENDTSPWGLLEEDDDMTTKAEFTAWLKDPDVRAALCTAVMSTDGVVKAPAGSTNPDGTPNTHWAPASYLAQTYNAAIAARGYSADARALVAKLQEMDPSDIAAAIPAAVAAQVADLLAARLAA